MDNGIIKYRKKPVTIEAIQWTGLNPTEIKGFIGDACEVEYYTAAHDAGVGPVVADITIHTLEGDMKVGLKDYVIKGVNGEFYPCKPGIFKQTYEIVCARCGRPISEFEVKYCFQEKDGYVCGDCHIAEENTKTRKWGRRK